MEEDSISMLPDEVIEVILSRLTITEAARTSILSSRWRHNWRYFSGSLDFDGHLMYLFSHIWRIKLEELDKFLPKERDKFISGVNQVLKSIQSPTLEGLRICFDMTDHSSAVDGWVQYAIQKKVKKLELDLSYFPPELELDDELDLWHDELDDEFYVDLYDDLLFQYDISSVLLNFTSLISLHLKFVDVSGESLECLLSSCPYLEELAVTRSRSLKSLRVSMPSSKLKRLEITNCNKLKTLQLNVKSLVSFVYTGTGRQMTALYRSFPLLVELSLASFYSVFVFEDFHHLFPYLSQLKMLKLEFIGYHVSCLTLGNMTELGRLKITRFKVKFRYILYRKLT